MNKLLVLMLLGLLLSMSSALRFLQEEGSGDSQNEADAAGENNPETGTVEGSEENTDEEVAGEEVDGQVTNQHTCNCASGSHDGYDNVCGESDDVHSAWIAARDSARQENLGVKTTLAHVLKAANDAGADESTAICVTFVAGVSTGADTCSLVNDIVKELLSKGISAENAETSVEEAVKKRYTWYTNYSQFCGERPDYSVEDEAETNQEQEEGSNHNTDGIIIDSKDNGGLNYLCGETEDIHKAWTEAKKNAEQSGANDGEIFQAAALAAIKAGADDKTANCVSFVAGDDTKIPLCELINWVNAWWIRRLLPMETVEGWTDEAVRKVYPCYNTYANFCGERPFYALDTGAIEEEVASDTNSDAINSNNP